MQLFIYRMVSFHTMRCCGGYVCMYIIIHVCYPSAWYIKWWFLLLACKYVCISLMYLHIMRTLCGLFNSLFNIKHCPIFCGLPSITYIFFSCCCICHYYILCLTHTDTHNTYKCKQYSLRDPDPLQPNPMWSTGAIFLSYHLYIVLLVIAFVVIVWCC